MLSGVFGESEEDRLGCRLLLVPCAPSCGTLQRVLVPLEAVLLELVRQSQVEVYLEDLVAKKLVSVAFSDLAFEQGLERVLLGTNYALVNPPNAPTRYEVRPGATSLIVLSKSSSSRASSSKTKIRKLSSGNTVYIPHGEIVAGKATRRVKKTQNPGSGQPLDQDPVEDTLEATAESQHDQSGEKTIEAHARTRTSPKARENQPSTPKTLGDADVAKALPPLEQGLAHPDPKIRRGVVEILIHMGGEKVIPLIERAVNDPDESIRKRAAEGLQGLTTEESNK